MITFITANIANIIIIAVIGLIVSLTIRSMVKDKKSGASCSCGSSCGGCPGSAYCHSTTKETDS